MPQVSAGLLVYRHVAAGGSTGACEAATADAASAGPTTADAATAGPTTAGLEVLLVHPGGPYWAKRDSGAWSIPKGEAEPGELGEARPVPERDAAWRRPPQAKPRLRAAAADLLAVAKREFREETGFDPDELAAPGAAYMPLGGVKQRGHKIVYVWAIEGDCDESAVVSETFDMEWLPRSGRTAAFPEVDRAAWFDMPTAREKILAAQRRFLDDLMVVVIQPPLR